MSSSFKLRILQQSSWLVVDLDKLHLWQASNRVNVRVSVSWEWCNGGKWPVSTGCLFDRLPLSSLETQLKTLSSGQCVELTHCPLYFTFKNAILDKITVQCLSWEVNNPSQVETDATKSQAWHQFWRKSPQHRKVRHRPHMTVLRFLFDKQDVKCAALLTQISHNDDRVRFFWHMALMHGDFRFYISDTF